MYINNLEKLLLYCRYFRKETQCIQKKVENFAVNFGKHIGANFHQSTSHSTLLSRDKDFKHFHLLNASLGGLELMHPLTIRELQCLELLIEGLSASQIGSRLNISFRTVEHNILHIKDKLSCSSKSDLFSYVATLKECGGNLSFLNCSWK
jgi:DNA-binding CsgD family transcriptional regulator